MKQPRIAAVIASAIAAGGIGGIFALNDAFNIVDRMEGNRSVRYLDPLGIPTICRGTTSGPLIAKGRATVDECDQSAVDDLKDAADVVRRCAPVKMTQGEFNAWTSFAYNVGPGRKGVKDGFCVLKSGKQPTHLRLLLRDDKPDTRYAACGMLYQWAMPGTVVYNGLLRRRTAEHETCVKDLP